MIRPVLLLLPAAAVLLPLFGADDLPYPIVDTGQTTCYDDSRRIGPPSPDSPYFGQDAQYRGRQPSYRDNRDGTVTDLVTGLMWQQDPGEKMTLEEAEQGAARCRLAGHDDWRLPTIKELYSLILFSGTDPDPRSADTSQQRPFIDTGYFKFEYGDPKKNERIIDSQFASSTRYVSTTMRADETMFGVNFADGRIKGYGLKHPRTGGEKTFHLLYVRSNPRYGLNDFRDNGDGTVTDRATGLTWMKKDSGNLKAGKNKDGALNWPEALVWAEELDHAGHDDWRLPNAKELQSIVDYTRSPDATDSAAIDPIFEVSPIENTEGRTDYPYYWTGTTHAGTRRAGSAAYFAFGESPGWMQFPPGRGNYELLDVHGAGSQRSDPKTGDPARFPHGRGPQGDVIRIYNHVRCVRGGQTRLDPKPVSEERTQSDPPRYTRNDGPDRPPPPEPPERGGSEAGNRHFQRLDKNGDGELSRSEFDGPARHFRELDRNRDGVLTEGELPPHPPSRRPPPRRR